MNQRDIELPAAIRHRGAVTLAETQQQFHHPRIDVIGGQVEDCFRQAAQATGQHVHDQHRHRVVTLQIGAEPVARNYQSLNLGTCLGIHHTFTAAHHLGQTKYLARQVDDTKVWTSAMFITFK